VKLKKCVSWCNKLECLLEFNKDYLFSQIYLKKQTLESVCFKVGRQLARAKSLLHGKAPNVTYPFVKHTCLLFQSTTRPEKYDINMPPQPILQRDLGADILDLFFVS
jgi:hypothetical protein